MVQDSLVHNCTIFLCSLDAGNIDDQCRCPSKNEKDHLVVTNLANNDDDGVRAPVTFCLYLVRTSTVRGRGLFIFYYFLFQPEIIFYYFLILQARSLYFLLFSVPSRNYFDQTIQQSSDDEVAENNSKQFNSVSSLDYRFINF